MTKKALVFTLFAVGLVVGGVGYYTSWFGSQPQPESIETSAEGRHIVREEDYASAFKPTTKVERIGADECFALIEETHSRRNLFQAHYRSAYFVEYIKDDELENLLILLEAKQGGEWSTIQLIALLRWSVVNGEGLVDFLNRNKGSSVYTGRLGTLFRYWAIANPSSAMELSLKLDPAIRPYVRNGLVMTRDSRVLAFVKENAAAFLLPTQAIDIISLDEAFESELWRNDYNQFYQSFMQEISNGSTDALSRLETITVKSVRERLIRDVANRFPWQDPRDGLDWILSLGSENFSNGSTTNLIGGIVSRSTPENVGETLGWLTENLDKGQFLNILRNSHFRDENVAKHVVELDVIRELPASRLKDDFLNLVVSSWATTEREAAIEWAEANLHQRQVDSLKLQQASNIFSTDGIEAAKALIFDIVSPDMRRNAVQNLAHEWVNKDPLEMVSWVLTLEDSNLVEQTLSGVSPSWANTDLDSLMEFERGLPGGKLKSTFQYNIANKLSELDPLRGIEFAIGIDDRSSRQNALNQALSRLAVEYPQEAMTLVAELAEDEGMAANQSSSIAHQWSSAYPLESMQYFESVDRKTIREAGIKASISNYFRYSPDSAASYIESLDKGPMRDGLILQVVSQGLFTEVSREKAVGLLEMIEDDASYEYSKTEAENQIGEKL